MGNFKLMLIGTIANTAAVIAGSLLGLIIGRNIPSRFGDTVMKGLGMCTLYIGVRGLLDCDKLLSVVLAIVLGAVIGEALDLDGNLEKFSKVLEAKLQFSASKNEDHNANSDKVPLAQGFVTASLLFCVGAMAVVGSLQDGLSSDHSVLYIKSYMDFASSLILASSLGIGVIFAAVSVFVYQGGLAVLANFLAPYLSEPVVAEMSCVGLVLILGLGLNVLGLCKLKLMNYVPAIFMPIILCRFF